MCLLSHFPEIATKVRHIYIISKFFSRFLSGGGLTSLHFPVVPLSHSPRALPTTLNSPHAPLPHRSRGYYL